MSNSSEIKRPRLDCFSAKKRSLQYGRRTTHTKPKEYISGKRHYSEEEKAIALATLAANDGNIAATARQTEVTPSVLKFWSRGQGIYAAERRLAGEIVEEIEEKIERGLHLYLDLLLDKTRAETSTQKEVREIFDTLITKHQLLKGKATSIIGREELSDEERIERFRSFAARVKQRLEQTDGGRKGGVPVLSLPPPTETVLGTVPEQPPGDGVQQSGP